MGWLALGTLLLCGADGGRPPPKPLVIYVDAGTPPPDPQPDDARVIEDLDLLRQYELLKVYPLLAPE